VEELTTAKKKDGVRTSETTMPWRASMWRLLWGKVRRPMVEEKRRRKRKEDFSQLFAASC
jgi:hypothetical protein